MTEDTPSKPFDFRSELTSQENSPLVISNRVLSEKELEVLNGLTCVRPVTFENVTFQALQSAGGELVVQRAVFNKPLAFRACSFECRFLRFAGCKFEESVDFYRCERLPEIFFWNGSEATGNVHLRHCRFDRLEIIESTFNGRFDVESCSFNGLIAFRTRSLTYLNIEKSCFERKLDISNCEIGGWLHLNEVRVKPTPPVPAHPGPYGLVLQSSNCTTGVIFEGVHCDGSFILFNTTIDGPLHFQRDTQLNGEVCFQSVFRGPRGDCSLEGLKPAKRGALEPIYRYAKTAKAAFGDLDAAGELYMRERRAHNAAARAIGRWRVWPWSKNSLPYLWASRLIGDWVMGYGERPQWALIWALGVLLFWAFMFWGVGGIAPAHQAHSFGDCFYFSVITFTTVGYGDLTPTVGFGRIIAMAEAGLGVTLMPLFLVTLARKVLR